MQSGDYEEIEMQTYSMPHSQSDVYTPEFNCEWDSDAHFDMSKPWSVFDEPRDVFMNFDHFPEDSFPKDPYKIELMVYEDKESLVSGTTSSGTTQTTEIPAMEAPAIYKKLDFILESVKRHKRQVKDVSDKKKLIRKRKTNEQLQALQNELHEVESLDKEKINEVAEKTGLRPGQVYKWFWDYKKKQAEAVQ
eukprot:TRINITY_DN5153_c0_g1_i4.p1 TRINITY_DN5153_c0_g1~~TRINITY_DN5153_c0_g1_i4.p1  ORF type:complete len:192 (-),score=76.18 TRINITY_DN5153_c0_g1_i4:125-700(-)